MTISTKKRIGVALAVAAALALGACTTEDSSGASDKQTTQESPHTNAHSDASWVIDIQDQRQVAGFADAVFVGTVLEQSGFAADRSAVPETQFRVQVSNSLKGEVAEEVTVNQQGGTDPKTGEVILLEEDPMIEVGKSYLFATRYNADFDFYTVVPFTGHEELDPSAARGVQPGESDVVKGMQDAIANEIPYEEPQPHVVGPNGETKPSVAPRLSGPPESVEPNDPMQSGAPTSTMTVAPTTR
ncbi:MULTISPECIES: hypothetical protein [unclassified Rhodococcus (in: high G+C Gram-positive bacteria)]|uniref:hypothetical protein n=1 Tax=unclassified Rhodococcus (in: high G+C Gram-positive bacteria) TaxID=192944 RepID=UPI0007DAE710|nr:MULTISPECIES: hypothetical protein [unclassified Rhodococcus (in: high G+C Gram-positive bacteria)]AZI65756.1 hypothetical protein EHW12_32155 [Rhodococcus sp. NJ-530]